MPLVRLAAITDADGLNTCAAIDARDGQAMLGSILKLPAALTRATHFER
jgi:hypothetical protein